MGREDRRATAPIEITGSYEFIADYDDMLGAALPVALENPVAV